MATLYQTAQNARKGFLIILLLIAIILGWDFISRFSTSVIVNRPAEFTYYKDPDNVFGDIATPVIKGISIDSKVKPVYATDSIFGVYPNVAYVYKIEKPREKLTTVEAAIVTANGLGFTGSGYKVTESNKDLLQWISKDGAKTLEFNKATQVWSMKTNYANSIEAKKNKVPSDISTYNSAATTIIQTLGFSSSFGLPSGRITVLNIKLGTDGDFFIPDKPTDANYAFIDLQRSAIIANLKSSEQLSAVQNKSLIPREPDPAFIYGSDPRKGQMRMVVSGELKSLATDIYEFYFTNFEYSIRSNEPVRGNYYIVTPQEAWTKVQNGQGTVTYLVPQNANTLQNYNNLTVKRFIADAPKTELAYYEPEEYSGYLYPIYIFSGNAELDDGRLAGFKIYVDALLR